MDAALRDRRLLYASAFVRAVATALCAVVLGVHLPAVGLGAEQVGYVVGAGLAGAAAASALATFRADRWGRRRFLLAVALLATAGTLAVALSSSPPVLVAAAFAGMLNGMGRDRGAALVVESAMLAGRASDATRTRAFAMVTMLQAAGSAMGSALAGFPAWLERAAGLPELDAMRATFGLGAVLFLVPGIAARGLSASVEQPATARARVSPEARRVLWRVGPLFGLDSLGGGFLTATMLTMFFHERFGASPGRIGALFAAARLINAGSHAASAWLAGRIGLLRTMVFTHAPSSLLLLTVACAPSFGVAAALFLLREGLSEMDVPTRQSYLMAVVPAADRTFVSGLTLLVRTAGWAIAPALAGASAAATSLALPLVLGAGLKLAYDVCLYAAFRRTIPPEEKLGPGVRPEASGSRAGRPSAR